MILKKIHGGIRIGTPAGIFVRIFAGISGESIAEIAENHNAKLLLQYLQDFLDESLKNFLGTPTGNSIGIDRAIPGEI